MGAQLEIKPPSKIRPTVKILYRFITGLHLDGKQRRNFRTGKVMPQYRDYFWNRYSRPRRAFYRICGTTIVIAILYGAKQNVAATQYCLLAFVPFLVAWISAKTIRRLTQRIRYQDSSGAQSTYITLKPSIARRLTKLRVHIRVHPPGDKPVPGEWEKPIRAQMAEDGIAPVQSLRMPIEQPRDLSELLAEQGAQTGRERTHRRNAGRGLRDA